MNEKYFKTDFGLMYYEKYESDETNDSLILLHGWGMNCETFGSVIKRLEKSFNIYNVDFIGFGKSDIPLTGLSVNDYSEIINSFIKYNKIKNPIIIGHSFGGRVAIKYGSKYNYKKIFLVNTPAFKNKSIIYYLNIIKYKIKKFYYFCFRRKKYYSFIKNSGSSDYKQTKESMKGTFKKVVRCDLKKELQKLKGSVVILSSVNDRTVSYKDNQKMYKLIQDVSFYTFYNSNHFSYIEEEGKFINIIRKECDIC